MLNALTTLVWLISISMVRSQDTANPTPAPTGTPVIVEVQCYLTDSSPILSEDLPVQENTANLPALPTGVRCYSIGPDGSPAATPFTTIGVSYGSSATSSAVSSEGTSSEGLKVILPAVLCSIIAAVLLIVGLLWYRKSKKSGQSRQSRAWVQRPDGWVQFTGNDKEDPQDIALRERQTSENA